MREIGEEHAEDFGRIAAAGFELDDDAQHSYHNIERYGFRRTHARANWARARTV